MLSYSIELLFNIKNLRIFMFIEKYFVTHYLVTYLNDNKEKVEIMVPNLEGKVLFWHDIKALAINYIKENTNCLVPIIQRKFDYYGICVFCDEFNILKKSHAIPFSIFKGLLKKIDGGQPIVIKTSESKLMRDSDTWAIQQLCGECEKYFNDNYEKYSIDTLRGKNPDVKVTKFSSGISFKDMDQNRVAKYFLSVYWRAALSIHPSYSSVMIFPEFNTYIKAILRSDNDIHNKVINIRMFNLFDEDKELSDEAISSFMVSPFTRIENKCLTFCLKLESYYVEIKISKLSYKEKLKKGYLLNNRQILFIENRRIFSIKEILHNFVHGKFLHENAPSKA